MKAAGKAVQIRIFSWAPSSDIYSASDSMECNAAMSSKLPAPAPVGPGVPVILFKHLLSAIHAIGAMEGRKPQVPSRGLAVQVHTECLVINTCKGVKGLGNELVGLDATRGSTDRKKGATDTKDARYTTNYLDPHGT